MIEHELEVFHNTQLLEIANADRAGSAPDTAGLLSEVCLQITHTLCVEGTCAIVLDGA
jgi:hypothetical protein